MKAKQEKTYKIKQNNKTPFLLTYKHKGSFITLKTTTLRG